MGTVKKLEYHVTDEDGGNQVFYTEDASSPEEAVKLFLKETFGDDDVPDIRLDVFVNVASFTAKKILTVTKVK